MYYRDFITEKNIQLDEVLVYLRKSRADNPLMSVEEVLSLHEGELDRYATAVFGAPIPEENKMREVGSGETIAGRVIFQKVLRLIESPRYRAVLVVETERLSRGDLEDAGRIIRIFRYTNTLIITPQRVYDLTDEYDRESFERELKRGNDYLEYSKKIMKRGSDISVRAEGNYAFSVAPYGYERVFYNNGKRKRPTLKIREDQADVIRMVYDLYVNEGASLGAIARHLNSLGIPSAKGTEWARCSVREILTNPIYIGKIRLNYRKRIYSIENGEVVKTSPRSSEYETVEGRHEPIIDEDTYNAAINRVALNPPVSGRAKIRNAFAGLLYCSCGKPMTYQPKSQCEPRLYCSNQVKCGSGSSVYIDVEKALIEALRSCLDDIELTAPNQTDSSRFYDDRIRELERRLEDIEKREVALWEAQIDPDPNKRVPKRVFESLTEKIQAEREEVESALAYTKEQSLAPQHAQRRTAMLHDALDCLADPNAPVEKKNKLLKACIERIIYNRKAPVRGKPRGDELGVPKMSGWISYPIELEVFLRV